MTMNFELSEQWWPKEEKMLLQCSQLHHQGEFGMLASEYNGDHDGVDRIFMAFPESYIANNSRIRRLSNDRQREDQRPKGSELHHQGEFLHNYYTLESVHKGDGTVRILPVSCEVSLITLHYIMQHNFHYTRSGLIHRQCTCVSVSRNEERLVRE